MKSLIDFFFPPIGSLSGFIILSHTMDHLADRIYSTGCFREAGTLPREDIEAMAILALAMRECI